MEEKLQQRLESLRGEYLAGKNKIAELEDHARKIDAQIHALRETMLRISGAIQVLEEETRGANNHKESVTQNFISDSDPD